MKNALIVSILLATVATGLRAQTGSGRPTVKATVSFSPVLEIKLGSGKDTETALALSTPLHYEDGVSTVVDNQLSVFSVGNGGYNIKAKITSATPGLIDLFRLGAAPSGTKRMPTNKAVSGMTFYSADEDTGDGPKELAVGYSIIPLKENAEKFAKLLGSDKKEKTYYIDVVYTIESK